LALNEKKQENELILNYEKEKVKSPNILIQEEIDEYNLNSDSIKSANSILFVRDFKWLRKKINSKLMKRERLLKRKAKIKEYE